MILTNFEKEILKAYRENPTEITEILKKVTSLKKECEKPLSVREKENDKSK